MPLINALKKTWTSLSGNGKSGSAPGAGTLEKRDIPRIRELITDCLAERGGEVSARKRAMTLGNLYLSYNNYGRKSFLEILANDFDIDRQQVRATAEALLKADAADENKAIDNLHRAIHSPRRKLLKQFHDLPQGIKFLVDMRADLRSYIGDNPRLITLDRELRGLLADWFDIGFLELRRIDWNSPAALLEKLIAYEAVHQISSWSDLRNRLESDRRCYGFFHPGMPEEPLIFIEVALVKGISTSIQELLDSSAPEGDPTEADTAIFYSISNTQDGLLGISFGNFLIKRVVADLQRELPNLKTYSTLSPIPGFAAWLKEETGAENPRKEIAELNKALHAVAKELRLPSELSAVLARSDWHAEEGLTSILRPPLEKLCAIYLHCRRANKTPLDPVQRFHLGNGARLEQINWLGDTSPKGIRQAHGFMVNYLYKLSDIEKNHEEYTDRQKIVASAQVKKLL